MSSISGVSGASACMYTQSARQKPSDTDLFSQIDTDGDGTVSVSELEALLANGSTDSTSTVAADAKNLMSSMDTDGDGKLSESELAAGLKAMGPPPPPTSTLDFAASTTSSSSSASGSSTSDGTSGFSAADIDNFIAKLTAALYADASALSSSSASSRTGSQLSVTA